MDLRVLLIIVIHVKNKYLKMKAPIHVSIVELIYAIPVALSICLLSENEEI